MSHQPVGDTSPFRYHLLVATTTRPPQHGGKALVGLDEVGAQLAVVRGVIGSLRRECLDHLLITGPRHLDLVLREYVQHFNTHRPHRSLDQRPPAGSTPPCSGATVRPLRRDRLGGLIYEYVQVT